LALFRAKDSAGRVRLQQKGNLETLSAEEAEKYLIFSRNLFGPRLRAIDLATQAETKGSFLNEV